MNDNQENWKQNFEDLLDLSSKKIVELNNEIARLKLQKTTAKSETTSPNIEQSTKLISNAKSEKTN